mmetsp:Transcript_19006/g.41181  ORF Transcript_19006/g.41181 Transcript_19006/m.41181 type:complete len:83 (-) Transcript_19006:3405-3653(-)
MFTRKLIRVMLVDIGLRIGDTPVSYIAHPIMTRIDAALAASQISSSQPGLQGFPNSLWSNTNASKSAFFVYIQFFHTCDPIL